MKGERKYRYRGLAMNCTTQANLHYVQGVDKVTGGGGILEWCCSEQDAREMKALMAASGEFTNLRWEKDKPNRGHNPIAVKLLTDSRRR